MGPNSAETDRRAPLRVDRAHILYVGTAPAGTLVQMLGPGAHVPALPDDGLPIASERPDVIVVGADRWAWDAVLAIAAELRPAVLAVGAGAAAFAAHADEWLMDVDRQEEVELRVQIAIERGRARRQFAKRVFVDPLTALPNRRAALRAAVREAARARRKEGALSVVLLDLDDFKQVNERGGHAAGDRVLRRVGLVLRTATRGHELCARIGGDEFAIVISGDVRAAGRAARRMQAALAQEGVSASAGIAELAAGESLRALYRRADDELRMTKALRHRGPPTGQHVSAWWRRDRSR